MRDGAEEALADLVEAVEQGVIGTAHDRRLKNALSVAKWTLGARGYAWSMHERKFIRRPTGELRPVPGSGGIF
jgi:hypothetical protein